MPLLESHNPTFYLLSLHIAYDISQHINIKQLSLPFIAKALTVKKIEVEPYKWLKELDETVDQDGEIFSLRALTEKLSVQQGLNEQFSDLYSAWQGRTETSLRSAVGRRFGKS